MHAQIERLYRDVAFLTELRPFRNFRNLASLNKVCDYIQEVFDGLGLDVEEQTWQVGGTEYKNVIAFKEKCRAIY